MGRGRSTGVKSRGKMRQDVARCGKTGRQADRQARQTNRQVGRHADRQADRQAKKKKNALVKRHSIH